ncbi:MAG: nitroreductase [Candidatus Lokiarchaeota archaeon]|nr:nitroreductase [Candidatus Lokiarchaeota archaeon]
MDVAEAIKIRRAYRSFESIEINENIIKDLARYAQLAPSCMNNQPWKYIFIRKNEIKKILSSFSSGNQIWSKNASLIVGVFTKKDDDCIMKERKYYLFDVGLATAFLILRATELGLVAHPIAGFDDEKAKLILKIPAEMLLITFIIIGKKSNEINPELNDYQKKQEISRPARKKLKEFIYLDNYENRINE